MSHFQLGNKDEANQFRQQLTEAMKQDDFKNHAECLKFVEEVDALFEGPLSDAGVEDTKNAVMPKE